MDKLTRMKQQAGKAGGRRAVVVKKEKGAASAQTAEDKARALTVVCPSCFARAGEPCIRTGHVTQAMDTVHGNRLAKVR